MDKEIKDLIDYISRSNFVEFELEREGFKIKLVKGAGRVAKIEAAPQEVVIEEKVVESSELPKVETAPAEALEKDNLFEVKSPIVGTFYRAPDPKAPPYVEVGDLVRKGQILCIVEAMKLMNEIESEVAGEIVEILVPNAHPVEYGQVLFRLRPAE
ncbi:MAG: acetyl-CoA carboxylase biotin carboxyl carrier protein [Acidobacteriota bacterium]